MLTAEIQIDDWLWSQSNRILNLIEKSGFVFEVRQISSGKIAVKCDIPNKPSRFIIFEDHREQNSHGGKPHVCNKWWVNEEGKIPFGWEYASTPNEKIIIEAKKSAAIMCLTQTLGYEKLKEQIF
jgi:hypothetical protein